MSERLRTIVSLVPKGARVVDIGCDHCKVANALLLEGIASVLHATEVAGGPFFQAKAACDPRVKLHLLDGLKGFSEEVDCAVIAGMGGELIIRILEESRTLFLSLDSIILQPMQQVPALRSYLMQNGYQIAEEALVREDEHYYQVLKVKAGVQPHYDCFFPWKNPEDPALLKEFLERERRMLHKIPETYRSEDVQEKLKRIDKRAALIP